MGGVTKSVGLDEGHGDDQMPMGRSAKVRDQSD